jgi:predicted metal-dependent hydrolase
MSELEVRRPRFDFTDAVPWNWNPTNPAFSFNMNATSMIAIGFEQMIVSAVQEARPLIQDAGVEVEAMAFLRQEAQHSATHRKHVNGLIRDYPGLQETFDEMLTSFDRVTATRPLEFRLAYVADTEATFTPSFKMMLDNEATLFRPGDERVASLFLWHFVEEVEHRSSALTIYDAVVGKPWYRMRVLPAIFRHLLEVTAIIADGVNRHVPEEERKIDARTMLPTYNMRVAVRKRLPFVQSQPDPVPPAFATVPWRQKLVAGARVLMSQTPFHDPAHEPLPQLADEWFARWNRGQDVTHYYTAEQAS